MTNDTATGGPTEPSFSPDDLLTTQQAAEYTGHTKHTLDTYRSEDLGRGPRFLRVGHGIVYRRADLDAYLSQRGKRDG